MKDSEKIIILNEFQDSVNNWEPLIGTEFEKFLNRSFPDDQNAREKVKDETLRIMRLCGDPETNKNTDTGLVLGYVQSGKTLSFTGLAALAKDNGYQIIIVIAGISKYLVEQSYSRLERDLGVGDSFKRRWLMLKNPIKRDADRVQNAIDNFKVYGEENDRIVLVVVMKNSSHLQNLVDILERINLDEVPTLIIDDEGDQASMNTKAGSNKKKGNSEIETITPSDMSAIYRKIRKIKSCIPHHTFVQYTATPQAPLFINILDNLSPKFVQLLEPGEKYTGGKSFFTESDQILIKEIPYNDIPTEYQVVDQIPESLKEAMRIFFLGVAFGEIEEGRHRNRTMMVHPSRQLKYHKKYIEWINITKDRMFNFLHRENDDDESKTREIDRFKQAYAELQMTVDNLPGFDRLFTQLKRSIHSTEVREINSTERHIVDWKSNYSFILVGGQALDRGFTVEGLTVTYMPRGKGVANADTIQQRARFYGYKMDYLGFCRVYLEEEGINLFAKYVEHEEDLRSRLNEFAISNKSFHCWPRKVILDEMFNLTRKNVLTDPLITRKKGSFWFYTKIPHDNEENIRHNKKVFDKFRYKYNQSFNESLGDPDRTEDQIHLIAVISLIDVYEDLLKELQYSFYEDSLEFTRVRTLVYSYLQLNQSSEQNCNVFLMKKGDIRERSENEKNNRINQLFQGKNPKTGRTIYPGDRNVITHNLFTVQLHNLAIKGRDLSNVVALAVWVPNYMNDDSIIEQLDQQ